MPFLQPTSPLSAPLTRPSDATNAELARRAALPLPALYEAWVAATRPGAETITQWRSIFTKLAARLAKEGRSDDARGVTEADLEKWRDDLRKQGTGGKRIKEGYLAAVRAVFGWAVKEKRLTDNPAKAVHVQVEKRAKGRERDFTDAEAAMILAASLNARPREASDFSSTRRWVPWLLAYSGARVAEITQLRKCDVIREREVDGIRITPNAGSTKTNQSRSVPLHPHVIEQGFLRFVASRPDGPLFYDPRRGGDLLHKKRAEQLAAWVRSIGVTDVGVAPNHGWRHRFKTEARRIRMDVEIRDYVQGHATRTEGENYGHMPLDVTISGSLSLPAMNWPRLSPPRNHQSGAKGRLRGGMGETGLGKAGDGA